MDILWQSLSDVIIGVILAVIAPAAAAIVVQVLRLINIQLSEAQRAKVQQVVANALLEVEEWASARLKAELPVTSGQKLTRAVEQIVAKVPNVTAEEAETLVRQELPKVGLGAVSFLAKTAQAALSPKP